MAKITERVSATRYPQTLQTTIVGRFMGKAEMQAFFDNYFTSRKRAGIGQPPTAQDERMAEEYKAGGITMAKLGQKYGLKEATAYSRIRKVAFYRYIKS